MLTVDTRKVEDFDKFGKGRTVSGLFNTHYTALTSVLFLVGAPVIGIEVWDEKHIDEVIERILMWQEVSGGTLLRNANTGRGIKITAEDIRKHKGVKFNIFPNTTRSRFDKNMAGILRDEVRRTILRAGAKKTSRKRKVKAK